MSAMQQSDVARKRQPIATAGARKRLKVKTEERPSLTQLLSRKSARERQLPLSQTSEDSDVPLATLAAQQKVKRAAELKSKAQSIQGTESQGDVVFELSTKRRVTVRKWKAMKFVDIREFYEDKGTVKPGKKGISLSPEQWKKLYDFSDVISEAIQLVEDDQIGMDSLAHVSECILRPNGDVRTIALPLSDKRRVTIRFFRNGALVDIREFYEQEGVSKPGQKGISLSKDQWMALLETADEITKAADRL